MSHLRDRRTFLRAAVAAGAAWATADLLDVENALAFARQQASAPAAAAQTAALTPAQTDVIAAVCSRIIPGVNGQPGAREAGAVYFIDRALATFNAPQRQLYLNGIADLNRRAQARVASTRSFASLTAAQQDVVLHAIETTPFFQAVRIDTIVGTFALPTWGGNRNYVGWHMLGLEHQMTFEAPFGYYDAEANRKS